LNLEHYNSYTEKQQRVHYYFIMCFFKTPFGDIYQGQNMM